MKAPIFLINPVKSYGQQMLILKVTSENVVKVVVTTIITIFELLLRFHL